ncbi:MAG TPA: SCO family protein [Candidatus Acidoferrales bacterium]|nr:SCO family protein [Candidatus Acidoferrales bacterium]
MKLATVRWKWLGTCVLLWACGAASLHAQNSMFGAGGEQPPTAPPSNKVPAILSGVDFTPPFGAKLPGDAQFRDDLGQSVKLGDYFGSKPVILAFGYYQCPMLCTEVQRGIASVLKVVKFRPGKDFSVVFISFNPKETPAMASEKKKEATDFYHHPGTESGWHFLVGDDANVRRVAQAAGFRYTYDPKTGLYAHATGILVLTPEGKISRVFYGIEYSPRDVDLGLVDSSEGRIGSPVDHFLLFCCEYDPTTGRYSATILDVIRLFGILVLLALGVYTIGHFWRDAHAAAPLRPGVR